MPVMMAPPASNCRFVRRRVEVELGIGGAKGDSVSQVGKNVTGGSGHRSVTVLGKGEGGCASERRIGSARLSLGVVLSLSEGKRLSSINNLFCSMRMRGSEICSKFLSKSLKGLNRVFVIFSRKILK